MSDDPARRGISLRPPPEVEKRLWLAAGRWSPVGIAAALLLLFMWLGGPAGIEAISAAIAKGLSRMNADQTRELEGFAKEVKQQNEETHEELQRLRTQVELNVKAMQRRQQVLDENLALVCDLTVELNHGKPHPTWCSEDGRSARFEDPPLGSKTPSRMTAAPWRKEQD